MQTSASRRSRRPNGGKNAAPERRSIALRDGALRVVVVADTHGRPHPKSGELIRAEKPDCVVHAGDIGDLAVLADLRKIAPVFAVRGNIDAPAPGVPEALSLDVLDGDQVALRLLLVHIAVFGVKLRGDVATLARSEGASLVVCGHSHIPFIGRDKGLVIFNPGSIGPRRFALPIVFGVLDVQRGASRMHHVDCETGQIWSP
jgi:hypothetical protein